MATYLTPESLSPAGLHQENTVLVGRWRRRSWRQTYQTSRLPDVCGEPPLISPDSSTAHRAQFSGCWWVMSAWCQQGFVEKRANSQGKSSLWGNRGGAKRLEKAMKMVNFC